MSAGNIRAGSAYVEIFARDSQFYSAMQRVQQKFAAVGAAVRQMGTQLTLGGAALGAPMAVALRQFSSFDDAIRMTGAVSQATAPQLAELTAKARELGATTSFTATQVAELMGELGRAGFSTDEIQDMTGAVLDLSRATGTDATASAGIMAATLRQFAMGAGDAVRVADVLTAAANKTFNSVTSLGEAFAYAGPVAAAAGMDLEETAAILGTLGNVGIQGSEAGTALRRLLTITGAEAEKLQGIFGVSFLDAAGNVRPLIDTLGEVAAATNDLASGERTKRFNEAFGLLGITSATVIGRVAADTRQLDAELRKVAGTAATTAKQMDAGLGGSLRILMSAVEGVALAFGDAVAPSLQALAQGAQRAADVVRQFLVDFPQVARFAAALAGGMFALGLAAIGAGIGIQIMAKGLAVVRVALAMLPALFSPVGLAIAGVVAGVGAAVVVARNLSPAFRRETDAIASALANLDLVSAWKIMNLNFAIALAQMGAAVDPFLRPVRDAIAATAAFIGDKLTEGLDRFMGVFGADIITLQVALEKLGVYFRAAFDWGFALRGMRAAIADAERRAAEARAKAPTADARAEQRAMERRVAADQRAEAADNAQAAWTDTIQGLRDELEAVHEQVARGRQEAEQAAPAGGPAARAAAAGGQLGAPAADAVPDAAAGAAGGPRAVGTFGSAAGLGIASQLAAPGGVVAMSPAAARAPAAAAAAQAGVQAAADLQGLGGRLSTGLEAVVRAVREHAALTAAGNDVLRKIAANTGRPGAALT
jgi:TP901 family phage tail tape measure protein